jgi:hypothetical protein
MLKSRRAHVDQLLSKAGQLFTMDHPWTTAVLSGSSRSINSSKVHAR